MRSKTCSLPVTLAAMALTVSASISASPIIVDNLDPGASSTGSWPSATAANSHYASGSAYAAAGGAANTFRFTPDLPAAGQWQVDVWNSCYSPRATDVPHMVAFDGGSNTVILNQDANTGICGEWQDLGTYTFAAGTAGYVEVSDAGVAGGPWIGADAVRFTPISGCDASVASLGDDPVTNGAALIAAVAALTPSAVNPCRLAIGPGTFDVGNTTLVLPLRTTLVGAGRKATVIAGEGAVIRTSSNSEVSNLAVENQTNHYAVIAFSNFGTRLTDLDIRSNQRGLFITGSANMNVAHVSVDVHGLNTVNHPFVIANSEANLFDINVTGTATDSLTGLALTAGAIVDADRVRIDIATDSVSAEMRGIQNHESTLTLRNSEIQAQSDAGTAQGLRLQVSHVSTNIIGSVLRAGASGQAIGIANITINPSGAVTIEGSTIEGGSNSITANNHPVTFLIGASKLVGPVVGSTLTCANSHDGSYVALDALCEI